VVGLAISQGDGIEQPGEQAPYLGVRRADPAQCEPCRDANDDGGEQEHPEVALYVRVDLVDDRRGGAAILGIGPRNLDQPALTW
jgi:hypothetical protein